MNTPIIAFMMVIMAIAGMIVSGRLSVEGRDKQLIDAWCRSEQVTLADYENCVKNSKPKWWPKGEK